MCKDSLKLSDLEDTPETKALNLMLKLCEQWKAGDEKLDTFQGLVALEKYNICKQLAKDLDAIEPTEGFVAPKVELDAAASDALALCIQHANQEILRC